MRFNMNVCVLKYSDKDYLLYIIKIIIKTWSIRIEANENKNINGS